MELPTLTAADTERFLAKVQVLSDEECWPWMAQRVGPNSSNKGGHGRFWLRGSKRSAHDVAWVLQFGPWPAGLPVGRHLCGHAWCVNPWHICPGTDAQNLIDTALQNRAFPLPRSRVRWLERRLAGFHELPPPWDDDDPASWSETLGRWISD